MQRNTYIYPAIFHVVEEGGYWVEFPDFPRANTQGSSLEEAISMAQECLGIYLSYAETNGEEIPAETLLQEYELTSGDLIHLIEIYMPPFREEHNNWLKNKK